MKTTPLNGNHKLLGAKMAEFAGFEMPIMYSSIIDEHLSVRHNIGLFDVSHMGEFIIKGKEALCLVQSVITNDASVLKIGQALYTCMSNEDGGVIDDLLVYRLSEDQCSEGESAYMLVVNASNIAKDFDWIKSKNIFDTRLIDISDKTGLLALQGPKAVDLMSKITSVNVEDIGFYQFLKGNVAGIDNVLISATGYTGSGGFELYLDKDQLVKLWNVLMEEGKQFDLMPCGLGARDTLRLEMGYCLYGHELTDSTSPIEAGLSWVTKLKKKSNFPSKDYFISQKRNKNHKKLIGIVMDGKRVPRQGYRIFDQSENEIGEVTSGSHSPTLDRPIALAYHQSQTKIGDSIYVKFGKRFLSGSVVKPPFVKI